MSQQKPLKPSRPMGNTMILLIWRVTKHHSRRLPDCWKREIRREHSASGKAWLGVMGAAPRSGGVSRPTSPQQVARVGLKRARSTLTIYREQKPVPLESQLDSMVLRDGSSV